MRVLHAVRPAVMLAALVFVTTAAVSEAATPTAMNFQGRLTNGGGATVPDGSYSVSFTVYDAAAAGSSKWTETQSVATTNGVFSVLLGTVNPLLDTVFAGTHRYLGVKVGADPELTPRTRLVSVPYADRVHTLDGSTGGAISGNINLDSSTATTGNLFKNGTRFLHNSGGFANTCLGLDAGGLGMAGDRNTAIGLESLKSNHSGAQNTAVGAGTLTQNDTGSFNTATGFGALYNNQASENNAFGDFTLYNNTMGSKNCGFGTYALYFNTTGTENTAIGHQALYSNGTGIRNTACGYKALWAGTFGGFNTAVGAEALPLNSGGSGNTAVGSASMAYNTEGYQNCAIGSGALYLNLTGYNNTAVGYGSNNSSSAGSNNTAIGFFSDCSGNLSNATAIGSGASVTVSDKIRFGNAAVTVIEGQVAYTFTSDRNQKENFRDVDGDGVLRKIRGLSLTSWNYKNNDPSTFRHYGPVAQEFFAAFGEDGFGTCGDSTSINSGDEAGIMMIAIQALEKRTAAMELVRAENADLYARLEKLEAMVNEIASTHPETKFGVVQK